MINVMNAYGIKKKDINMLYNMLEKFHNLAEDSVN